MPTTRSRLRALAPHLAVIALTVAACAAPGEPDPAVQPYQVQVDGDVIKMSVNQEHGLPVKDLINLAQKLTGKVYTYPAAEVDAAEGISLVGTVSMRQEDFYDFFRTLMRLHAFECVERDGVVEIVPFARVTG